MAAIKAQYETIRKKIRRLFPEREFLMRQNGDIKHMRLTTGMQGFLCVVAAGALCWSTWSSRFFIRYDAELNDRDVRISQMKQAYGALLEEVGAYRDHLGQMTDALSKNLSEALEKQRQIALLEEQDSESAQKRRESLLRETARLERERAQLQNEIMHVEGRLSLLSDDGAVKESDTVDMIEISLRKALLQRDLATSENEELRERVVGLENMVAEMQDAQVLAFQKMADLADGGIGEIETRLADVRQSLSRAGLSMDSLLNRIRRENVTTAVGGPFVPANMPNLKHKNLDISLVSLNTRLNRWYDLTALEEALPVGKPLDRIRVTSSFGAREDPFQGAPARHEAVDLGGMTGEAVYATAPGKVSRAGRWGWYGNIVEIDHGMGFTTRYAHMDKVFVQKGDTVRSGDEIGSVGSTGRSTGPHLHYEVRVKGAPVDPMKFIKASKDVFKK